MPNRTGRSAAPRQPGTSQPGSQGTVLPPSPANDSVRDCVNHCADDENPLRCALVYVQQLVSLGRLTEQEARETFDRSLAAMQAMNSATRTEEILRKSPGA